MVERVKGKDLIILENYLDWFCTRSFEEFFSSIGVKVGELASFLSPPPDAHHDGHDHDDCCHCNDDDGPKGKARSAEIVTPGVGGVSSWVSNAQTVEDVQSIDGWSGKGVGCAPSICGVSWEFEKAWIVGAVLISSARERCSFWEAEDGGWDAGFIAGIGYGYLKLVEGSSIEVETIFGAIFCAFGAVGDDGEVVSCQRHCN